MTQNDKYLVQLRRELVKAQARLKRAERRRAYLCRCPVERECDRLRLENQRLKDLVAAKTNTRDREA